MVQWLRPSPSNAGGCRFNPWLGIKGSTCLWVKKPRHKGEKHCNKFNKDFKNGSQKISKRNKNPPAVQETWVRKMPWRKEWLPTPVSVPAESPGQRSLEGHSPWGLKESYTTEQLTHIHTASNIIYKSECINQ